MATLLPWFFFKNVVYYVTSKEDNTVRATFDEKKEAKAYIKNNKLKRRYRIDKLKLA